MHRQLSAHFDTRFVGPVNPSSDYRAKLVSKVRRVNGRAGSFHFFSERRLKKIAKLVETDVDATAACDFFHGPTPWILYDSPRPYFVYTDTCFSTYVDVYHQRSEFLAADLKRICDSEARWLARARQVFFGTHWALERAVADYQIPRSNFRAVGAGGSMPLPDKDTYAGGMNFLFVSLDFERKGGRICAEAFSRVHTQFPEARLTIVGDRPPADIQELAGISYAGFLRKSVPAEFARLAELYASAFALVHPTMCDIQPLVISEAGYYGCPSIAARSFGIPELIEDGLTGFLIDTPLTADGFADRMLALCAEKNKYLSMRQAVRTHTTTNLTWQAVGDRIVREMTTTLGC